MNIAAFTGMSEAGLIIQHYLLSSYPNIQARNKK